MGTWILLTACDLLIPLMMIGFGYLMRKHPPKNINGLYGYRTSRSMKNRDTWHFANTYCGRLWWKLGWPLLLLTLIVHLPFMGYGENDMELTVLCLTVTALQCIVLIGSIFPVERALKREFDEHGVRKEYDKEKKETNEKGD